jgi:hypothetical protein
VWWHGDENWYQGRVLSHRVVLSECGTYEWMTSIEYENGTMEHHLPDVEYAVLEQATPVSLLSETALASGSPARQPKRGHLSVRRRKPTLRHVEIRAGLSPYGASPGSRRSSPAFMRV